MKRTASLAPLFDLLFAHLHKRRRRRRARFCQKTRDQPSQGCLLMHTSALHRQTDTRRDIRDHFARQSPKSDTTAFLRRPHLRAHIPSTFASPQQLSMTRSTHDFAGNRCTSVLLACLHACLLTDSCLPCPLCLRCRVCAPRHFISRHVRQV